MGCCSSAPKTEEITNRQIPISIQPQKYEGPQNVESIKTKTKKVDLNFDKEVCKRITSQFPKRTQTNLQSLKDTIKSKTEGLAEIQKAYCIFLWISQNIDYDANGYFTGRKVDCTPEGVFQNGKTVCSGYSRLFKDIATYIGLNVECISCYAKGVGYEPGQKMTSTNHEYNAINLGGNWYPIDCTWGSGNISGRDYQRKFNEFYFLANPELLIKSHFPKEDKWQLTEKKYTLEEFLKWPKIDSDFHLFEFHKFSPEEGFIELKNANTHTFTLWVKNREKKGLSCNVYLLNGNCYMQQPNSVLINGNGDTYEIDCIFNKKGKYKVQIFGNNDGSLHYTGILTYQVIVENDARNELKFPTFYGGSQVIKIIEPKYDNLRANQKVNFKIQSDLEKVIIIDGQWHYLEKNAVGFFEKEITIQTPAGKDVIIGRDNNGSCSYLAKYKVI